VAGATPSAAHPTVSLRHRRDARGLTSGQIDDFRQAIAAAQGISDPDDRSYQHWAGIHGLPMPISCRHASPIFLAWHRAYLYFFEKELQDRVAGVTFPWWDWTQAHAEGLPEIYSRQRTTQRRKNPLFDSPIQPVGRRSRTEDRTWREPGAGPGLPTSAKLEQVLQNPDFSTFQTQLEGIHNSVHGWVGGTMNDPYVAAYDPVFWAHHAMIDRCWYLWQLRHPGAGPPPEMLNQALPPFGLTVAQTLDITTLGYDYAATTTAVRGPEND
jgi:tyrosinase